MSEERIVEALRQGPPDEGRYQMAGQALYGKADTVPAARPRANLRIGFLTTAAAAAIAIFVAIGPRPATGPSASPSPSPEASQPGVVVRPTPTAPTPLVDLVVRIRAAGVLRVRVATADGVAAHRAAYQRAVALEVAKRLGVRAILDEKPVVDLLSGSGPGGQWDVVFAPRALTALGHRFGTFIDSAPYLEATHFVMVRSGSGATSLEGLAGHSICVSDSAHGLDWAEGRLAILPIGTFRTAPADLQIVIAATDEACLDQLRAATVDAILTNALTPLDLTALTSSTSGLTVLGPSVYAEALGVGLLASDISDRDMAAFSSIIEAMRADGTLRTLSEAAFAGQDLSVIEP
jgi:cystine transport system substrate-binding protein